MEYNVSARKPDHALKERMRDAAARADALISAHPLKHADETTACEIVGEYLRIRYLLEPSDMRQTAYLNRLGEMSVARGLGISVEAVRKNELDSKCEGTSSSMTKKILLVIALNKALGIDIDADTTANIVTVADLCHAVRSQLALKSSDPEHRQ